MRHELTSLDDIAKNVEYYVYSNEVRLFRYRILTSEI
jgi:hypothetical protein